VWSKERPRHSGWYWFRLTDPRVPEEARAPIMMLVSEEPGGRFCAEDAVNRERYQVRDLVGLWAGPLSPPEAALYVD
jgi:hypothetical protein